MLEANEPAAPVYSDLDGGMNQAFLARFADRLTLSKRIGLDQAQHPVELLMGAHERMRALEMTMPRAGEGLVEGRKSE